MFEIVIDDRFKPRRIKNFNDFTLTLNLDSISSVFGVSWLFNPEDDEHKNAICPSHFHEVQVYYNNELLLNGNLINQSFSHGAKRELVQIGGYSKTGVLEDSTVPIANYPLRVSGMTIENTVKRLCKIFDINVIVDSRVKARLQSIVSEEDDITPTDTIKSYIQKITEVKNVITTHNENGDLVITQIDVDKMPIFKQSYKDGSTPLTELKLSYNGQGMHRYITVLQQADDEGENGGQATIRNPYVVESYVKDKVITAGSGMQDDMRTLARQELSKELKGIKLSAEIAKWEIGDKLIKPGDLIVINDPHLYLYKDVTFVIDSVTYSGTHTSVTCSFTAALKDVYTTTTPENIYEGINIHENKY